MGSLMVHCRLNMSSCVMDGLVMGAHSVSRCVMRLLEVRSLVVRVRNGVVHRGCGNRLVIALNERLEMKVTVTNIAVERLMVKLVVFTVASVPMDNWIVISWQVEFRSLVDLSERGLVMRLNVLMDAPSIHRGAIF